LGFRPHSEKGQFRAERSVTFRLRKLDTGSTRYDKPRFADDKTRKIARMALSRNVGKGQESAPGATVVFEGADGKKIEILRLGDRLRWSNGKHTLVRTGKDQGFRIFEGRPIDATAEEQSKLEREFLLNPWLWRGEELRQRIADATLEGGLQALGYPAYRFRIPGPSEFEMFFYEDGSPAGYRYRDQLERQLIDVLVRGTDLWMVADHETLIKRWKLAKVEYHRPDAKLFEKPAQ
jgi:hypothetical protein